MKIYIAVESQVGTETHEAKMMLDVADMERHKSPQDFVYNAVKQLMRVVESKRTLKTVNPKLP